VLATVSLVKASCSAATVSLVIPLPRHSRESGNLAEQEIWVPAFAGMTSRGKSRRNLLADAVEASAPGQDVVGAEADCNAIGEQGLDHVDCGAVHRGPVLRDDHHSVADVEIHVTR